MAEKDYKTYTEHYKLVKPGDLEKYDIEEVTRTNADIIDTELKKHEIAISNLHNYDDTSIKKDMLELQKEQENHTELINNKVDKQEGKGLSTNDFTDTYKTKLDDLENYDDTGIKQKYNELQQENIELKKTQDDMIEKQLNKQTEADTSLVIKDTDEGYGKLGIYGGQRQAKRESSRNICQSQAEFWELGMYNAEAGQKVAHSSRVRCKDLTAVAANTEIYFNTFNDEYSFVIRTYDENKAFINSIGEKINGTKLLLADNIKYISNTIMRKGASGNLEEGQIILDKIKNGEIKPFICLSSETNKEFEEYGIMPSMNYPSEIECVGENINEFDKDSITENKYININNGTLGNSTTSHTSDYIKVYANETCILSYDYEELKAAGKRGYCYFDEDKKYISGTEYTPTNREIFFTPSANGYIRFSYDMNAYNIKFERNTKKTAYSDFGQGCVEISTSNKNLVKINENDFELIENGIKNKGRNSGVELTRLKVKKGEKIVVSLTLKSKPTKDTSIVCEINNADVHDSTFYALQTLELNKRFTREIIAEENTEIVYRMWGNANSDIFEFQFSASLNEATDYIEHRGKTHIMPIQQKMLDGDGFEKKDGIWYEKHDKGEYVLDGVNNKAIYLSANKSLRIDISDSIKSASYYTNQKDLFLLCTHFRHSIKNLSNYDVGEIVYWDTQGQLYAKVEAERFADLEEANNWLKEQYDVGTPVTIVYQRTEPVYIKCTDEQSAILDKIDTYKDSTIITTDNDLCKISLRYKQDLEKRIEQLEEQMIGGN